MSSFVPKINLGVNTKRSKVNLTSNNSTTTNIGKIQPTFCREMIPGSTFKMNSVKSFVRLAPLTVPTFAPMEFRHYHCFVPYNSLYFPFDSFLANQNYTNSAGQTFSPTRLHYINLDQLFFDFSRSIASGIEPFMIFRIYQVSQDCYLTPTSQNLATIKDFSFFGGKPLYSKYHVFHGANAESDNNTFIVNSDNNNIISADNNLWPGITDSSFDLESADLCITMEDEDFVVLVKYAPRFKELRKIFIGLGYQFSPVAGGDMNILRLLAFYKSWYQLFYPQREQNFFSTNCYKLISYLSNSNGGLLQFLSSQSYYTLLKNFFNDLMNMCYYLPTDYFSMSTLSTNPVGGVDLHSYIDATDLDTTLNVFSQSSGGSQTDSENNDYTYPIAQKLAQKVFNFVNKNTVIGRNIRDYLKLTFGVVDEHDLIHEEVHFIGSSSINLDVNDIFANSDTYNSTTNQGAQLGEYAGIGLGHGSSESFEYTAKEFGVWLTFSVVIPKGGYTQGTLRECNHIERLDFFTPQFDASYYQTLNNTELISDIDEYKDDDTVVSGAFGLVPAYSEYKVGFNRLNGDLSLRSRRSLMGKYTLDRYLSLENRLLTLDEIMDTFQNVPDTFRAIGKHEAYGNYNRIFNYTKPDEDHFIMHMVFDCEAIIPGKSLSNSYDTDENYDRTIAMSKQ